MCVNAEDKLPKRMLYLYNTSNILNEVYTYTRSRTRTHVSPLD